MSETKTHFKKLFNPDYLGAYALDPGKDLILTIKQVKVEKITNCDGRKEDAPVMRFEERGIKPMILNSTNSKTIKKIYETPYLEDWVGRKIQIFVEQIRAFGEDMEALRIRPFIPKVEENISTKCADCKADIEGLGNSSPEKIARYTYEKYGKQLCASCASDMNEKNKPKDVL